MSILYTDYWPCADCDAHEKKWGISGADQLRKLQGESDARRPT